MVAEAWTQSPSEPRLHAGVKGYKALGGEGLCGAGPPIQGPQISLVSRDLHFSSLLNKQFPLVPSMSES